MIFVALSTAALATIKKSEMTAATGLYNVVRQVFGSVGIALTATELTRGEQVFRTGLVKSITPYAANADNFLRVMTGVMMQQGNNHSTAQYKALNIVDGQLQRQASMLSYNHVFSLVTALFVLSVPLVFLLKGYSSPEEKKFILD